MLKRSTILAEAYRRRLMQYYEELREKAAENGDIPDVSYESKLLELFGSASEKNNYRHTRDLLNSAELT